ncbi:hypothetical protein GCM10009827_115250 [Dactylosporangium maewongense]|uniref:Uncharacterized protein n=1 Tax=Dactylosporangium maewongense TaxID=634393 RepID=A0ABP4P5T0_9ACTN
MARQSTNDYVERLRQRHAAELGAVRRVVDATERLTAAGVAVAASVTVFGGVERAASAVGMTAEEVRAPSGAVRAAVAGRRGGPGGGGRVARGAGSAVVVREDERDDSGDGGE